MDRHGDPDVCTKDYVEVTEEEIKPKRRARKTATPEEEAALILQDNGIATEEIAEEAPAKKPRAKKAAAATSETSEPEKPKRTRAKKAAVDAEPVVEIIEVIEIEEPVVARRRSRNRRADRSRRRDVVEEPVQFIDSSYNEDDDHDEPEAAPMAASAPGARQLTRSPSPTWV